MSKQVWTQFRIPSPVQQILFHTKTEENDTTKYRVSGRAWRRSTSQRRSATQENESTEENDKRVLLSTTTSSGSQKSIVRLRTKGRKRFCVKLELGFIDNTLGMRDSAKILLSNKCLTMLGFHNVLAWGLHDDRFADDWIHDCH